jgi:hypothetical protein
VVAAEAAVPRSTRLQGTTNEIGLAPHGRESSEVVNLFAMPGD